MDENTEKPVEMVDAGSAFIGGEIHIFSDPKTGSIRVNAPSNLVVAFGLLEIAKNILVDNAARQRAAQDAQRNKIIPGTSEALKGLEKAAGLKLS